MTQSTEHPSLGFGSSHNIMLCEIELKDLRTQHVTAKHAVLHGSLFKVQYLECLGSLLPLKNPT